VTSLYICKLIYFDVLCKISFCEHLHEDGHNRFPKRVGGYDARNTINFHICICTCWSYFYNDFMSFQVGKEVYEFCPEIFVAITFEIS